jgi:hypothetical protein
MLVDTNLLLLLLIGSYDIALVGANGFKRIAQYTAEDYELLVRLIKWFKITVTTPHVLTEVSNLAGQLAEQHKLPCFLKFAETFKSFVELEVVSSSVSSQSHFPRFGLTDSVITAKAGDYLVLTDDLRLCSSLEKEGHQPLNFNHIRTLSWN